MGGASRRVARLPSEETLRNRATAIMGWPFFTRHHLHLHALGAECRAIGPQRHSHHYVSRRKGGVYGRRMDPSLDSAAHVVQLALTPIFFLAGLATLLNVFTVRLGRIADRVDRFLAEPKGHQRQLARLRLRSRLLDGAVILASLSGALTCAAALTILRGALVGAPAGASLFALFGGALGCVIVALLIFSVETLLSGQTVREESHGNDTH